MSLLSLLLAALAAQPSEVEPASEVEVQGAVRDLAVLIEEADEAPPMPEHTSMEGSGWRGWHICVPPRPRWRVSTKRQRARRAARARREAQRRQYEARRRQRGRR